METNLSPRAVEADGALKKRGRFSLNSLKFLEFYYLAREDLKRGKTTFGGTLNH
jgi:hypothetical protein